MAISDTKLRTIYGKPYSGPQEVADADGLSVRISPKGVIQFQYRYRWHGKPNRLGLGRYPSLSLKDARQITADLRKLYFSGTDPRTYFEEKVENSMTVALNRPGFLESVLSVNSGCQIIVSDGSIISFFCFCRRSMAQPSQQSSIVIPVHPR